MAADDGWLPWVLQSPGNLLGSPPRTKQRGGDGVPFGPLGLAVDKQNDGESGRSNDRRGQPGGQQVEDLVRAHHARRAAEAAVVSVSGHAHACWPARVGGAEAALLVGRARPACWLVELLVAIRSLLWLFAVSRFLRADRASR
jgi:hypothetical protein